MIYRFKASISDQKGFEREYELRGDHTLYDFHEHIQNDLGFAPDQMVTFFSTDLTWTPRNEYGLFDSGNGSMDQHEIATLVKNEKLCLLYVFDIFHDRALRIEFLTTDDENPRKSYPRTAVEKGLPPNQFSDKLSIDGIEEEEEQDAALSDDFDEV